MLSARAKALVLPVIVPLATVVLIGVDHAEPTVALDAAKVAVDDVVAPAIELVTRLRRTVEPEKRAIERVALRNLRQHIRTRERARHLRLERLRVETIHVVIAVVGEKQTAILDVAHEPLRAPCSLNRTSLCPVMNRNGNAVSSVRVGGDHDLVLMDGDLRVLHDRVEDVRADLRVVVPVARIVAEPSEDEVRRAGA